MTLAVRCVGGSGAHAPDPTGGAARGVNTAAVVAGSIAGVVITGLAAALLVGRHQWQQQQQQQHLAGEALSDDSKPPEGGVPQAAPSLSFGDLIGSVLRQV